MEQQPFEIGQRILCVETHNNGYVREGKIYVVNDIKQFSCGCWMVDVGQNSKIGNLTMCRHHGAIHENNGIAWCGCFRFVPLESNEMKRVEFTKIIEDIPVSVN